MIDLGDGNRICGYGDINVILGKNGSGKSTLLRLLDTKLSGDSCCIRYITPERGGQLIYDGSIEANRSQIINWFEMSDVEINGNTSDNLVSLSSGTWKYLFFAQSSTKKR